MSKAVHEMPSVLILEPLLRREEQRQLHLRLLDAQIEYHLAYAQLANRLGEVSVMREHLQAAERSLQEFRDT